jgi:atlastin
MQLFTEYGKMAMEETGEKAFQNLVFLVRDWQNAESCPFGFAGGKTYIDKVLKV